MIKVKLHPGQEQIVPETGIGQVLLAQYKWLPEMGIKLVEDAHKADVIACHIAKSEMPRIDVLHCHGLYFSDLQHAKYDNWNYRVNHEIAKSAREARFITVPSEWVAMPFKRDMRLSPIVLGHGLELDAWTNDQKHKGYVLWNKNRGQDVCDPRPAYEMAKRGAKVLSTFAPHGVEVPGNMDIIGGVSHAEMTNYIKGAAVYLATTPETFGIGTIEALAAGVPVLGWNWGGTSDIVEHKKNGYLVEPGDYDGLMEGLSYILAHRKELSQNAVEIAQQSYSWEKVMAAYADLYKRAAEPESHKISVIITNYNYGRYVGEAIDSVLAQKEKPDEIIVVDDGSNDDSMVVIGAYEGRVKIIHQNNQGVAAARNNGIKAATGDFITCLDADDKLDPDFIGTLRKALVNDRGLGIAYTGLSMLNDDGKLMSSNWPPAFEWEIMAAPSVPPSNCIPSANMFRRSMWERAGGYRQQYAPGEDAEFWVRGLSVGFCAKKVTENPLFIYRAHSQGASKTRKYIAINQWHPWMKDKKYPFAAPAKQAPPVMSYIRPTISVIIPVGPGHQRHITAAIESVIGQSFRNWEIMLVNDTGEVIDLPQYPFLTIINTAGKTGAGAARNKGVSAAKGGLVLFLDADDYLDPDALQNMLTAYINTNGERYIYGDYCIVDHEGQRIVPTAEYDPMVLLNNPAMGSGVTVLMPKDWFEKVGGFDETMATFEDVEFFSRCAIMGAWGQRVPVVTFYYRTETGTRRPKDVKKYHQIVVDKNHDYITGVKKMGGCCGGNGTFLMEAKRMMNPDADWPQSPVTDGDGLVRMQYIGDNIGAISFTVHGHTYRGGNNTIDRYTNALPADVDALELTGKWKRIATHVVQSAPQAPAPVQAVVVPVKSEQELQAEAAAKLAAAKAAFAVEEPEPVIEPVKRGRKKNA